MDCKQSSNGYIVHLRRGEEIFTSLLEFFKKENLRAAWINGLGGVDEVELGFYDFPKKDYLRKTLKQDLELVAMVGNLAFHGETPMIHLHAVFGDDKFHTFSGHLFSARVAIVTEILVIPLAMDLMRSFDEEFQIKLIDI